MRSRAVVDPSIKVTDGRGRPIASAADPIQPAGGSIRIETDQYTASIATEGYVSGVTAGTFRDKRTGATDLGFGLSIVDFLLEPVPATEPVPPGQYEFGNLVHGKIPKRYVEGPQICTQAKSLPARVAIGNGFAAVRLRYRWNLGYQPRNKAGSVWEQTLIFPQGERFFLSADRVTTVSESSELFFRIDMPGHIKNRKGSGFEHVYLSYQDPSIIPSTEFLQDFAPDARFLYRRGVDPLPARFIRGYQVAPIKGEAGPWLAGMTLNPSDVYQAWCHQRGYICMIEEIGGRATRPGTTFGACYLVGWFDDPDEMARSYDLYRGVSGLALDGPEDKPTGYRGLQADELSKLQV
jgi:hypothetical protein